MRYIHNCDSQRNIQAFYWATSEWSAYQIEEAYRQYLLLSVCSTIILTYYSDVADKLGLVGPIAEQCQHQYVFSHIFPCQESSLFKYSMMHRERPEKEYA